MEEKKLETVIMPDGLVLSFEECLDNLMNTKDIALYLDTLMAMRNKYLIVLSVKDTPGARMPDDILNKIHVLGFSNFLKDHLRNYIGVIDRGTVLFDSHNEKESLPMEFVSDINGIHLSVKSESTSKGNAEIIIDGEDYSLNLRGINIVVFDFETKKVVDSSTYDGWLPKAPFYHKNINFDKAYFDNHLFVPERYKSIWKVPLNKKYFSNRKLSVRAVENGVVLPLKKINGKKCGGACDENYNLISGFFNFSHEFQKNDRCVVDSYIPDEGNVQYIDETVLYGGIYFDHPGHLMTETLANWLWYLTQTNDSKLKIAVVIYTWLKDISFFRQSMEAFGFPQDKIIVITSPTKFKKLLIPDCSSLMYLHVTPYEFTREWPMFFEHIRNNITPAKYKKIYLAKTKSAKNNVIGEDYFIDFYRKHGFEIIVPEDYTMKEKAELMLGADEIVTLDGTNCLFTVFCKPSVKVTILARLYDESYGLGGLAMIAEAIGYKDIYVVNIAAGFFHKQFTYGLILLTVTDEFKKYAKEVFNEEIDINAEEYLKNILWEYFKYIPEYYSEAPYFNRIKNQKMLTVLQNISQLFLNKDFDTSNLDVSTTESQLAKQVKDLTAQNNTNLKQIQTLSEEVKSLKSSKALLEKENVQLKKEQEQLNLELLESYRKLFKKDS